MLKALCFLVYMKIINDIIRTDFFKCIGFFLALGFSLLQVQEQLWIECVKAKKWGKTEHLIYHLK